MNDLKRVQKELKKLEGKGHLNGYEEYRIEQLKEKLYIEEYEKIKNDETKKEN